MVAVFRNAGALKDAELVDWGAVPGPLGEPVSHTRGLLLHRGEDGSPEAGYWECTPGKWRCEVTRDEFCHFLEGRCVYIRDTGERTEISGGDTAFFPAGWTGRCEVSETIRKLYMIR